MKYLQQYPIDLGNEKSGRRVPNSKPFNSTVDISRVAKHGSVNASPLNGKAFFFFYKFSCFLSPLRFAA